MTKAPKAKLNALYFALMLREFQRGPCTATEIADATGYARKTMVAILRTMHDQSVLHIAEWEAAADGRTKLPVYALGDGKDTPRPAPLSRAERNRRYAPLRAQRAVLGMAA